MKQFLFLIFAVSYLTAHPVAYSINLELTYDDKKKIATVKCWSESRNKCGLHNFDLVDSNKKKITTARFPFLKKKIEVQCERRPQKMVFFLRSTPEHKYISIVKK